MRGVGFSPCTMARRGPLRRGAGARVVRRRRAAAADGRHRHVRDPQRERLQRLPGRYRVLVRATGPRPRTAARRRTGRVFIDDSDGAGRSRRRSAACRPRRPTTGGCASRTARSSRRATNCSADQTLTTAGGPAAGRAGPGGGLAGRPVLALPRRDPARGGAQRVRAGHRAAHRAMLAGKEVVMLGSQALSDAQVSLLTNWVQGGGNLVAMRPDKKLAGLLGLTRRGGHAQQRVHAASTPARRPGAASTARRCSSTAPPTATRWAAPRRSRRSTRTPPPPLRTPPSRCARSGRAAARRRRSRTTWRARSSTRARATRLGRPEARRHAERDPPGRPLLPRGWDRHVDKVATCRRRTSSSGCSRT